MSASGLALALGAGWVAVGLTVGVTLRRQGQPVATAVAAMVAWPAMVGLLTGAEPAPPAPLSNGPYAAAIADAFQALRAALGETGLTGAVEAPALDAMEAALRRADARLFAVDRLLADPAVAADGGAARLVDARAHAAEEIEAVLRQLVTVRVQLGLVALAGDTGPVRAHLAELGARARALAEVAC